MGILISTFWQKDNRDLTGSFTVCLLEVGFWFICSHVPDGLTVAATITGSRNTGFRADPAEETDFHTTPELFPSCSLSFSITASFSVSQLFHLFWRSVPLPVLVFKWLKSFLCVINLQKDTQKRHVVHIDPDSIQNGLDFTSWPRILVMQNLRIDLDHFQPPTRSSFA